MADPLTMAVVASSLMAVGSQVSAGRQAVRESKVTAQIEETAATQRELDRKERLAKALATANAQAGAAGIMAFEGSPLTILNQSIENEQTATERDVFNTRISTLVGRARADNAKSQANIGAATSLLKGGVEAAQLMPE
jgi:hypothetical protein